MSEKIKDDVKKSKRDWLLNPRMNFARNFLATEIFGNESEEISTASWKWSLFNRFDISGTEVLSAVSSEKRPKFEELFKLGLSAMEIISLTLLFKNKISSITVCPSSVKYLKFILKQNKMPSTQSSFPKIVRSIPGSSDENTSVIPSLADSYCSSLNAINELEEMLGQEITEQILETNEIYKFGLPRVSLSGISRSIKRFGEKDFISAFQGLRAERKDNEEILKMYIDLMGFNEEDLGITEQRVNRLDAVLGSDFNSWFQEKFNLNLKTKLSVFYANHFFSWVDGIMDSANSLKLTEMELKAMISGCEDVRDLEQLSNLLQAYDKKQDILIVGEGNYEAITSIRELEKRVKAIVIKFDWTQIPEKHREKIKQLAFDTPGFNVEALQSFLNDPSSHDLLEGKVANWLEPRSRSYLMLSDVLRTELKVKNNSKLFSRLRQLVTRTEVESGQKVNAAEIQERIRKLFEAVPEEIEGDIIKILDELGIDKGNEFIVTVYDKSDPEGWVGGNFTDSCIPFGNANNTYYMFSPACQYFSVKIKQIDENGQPYERILTHSVLVDSLDTSTGEDVVLFDNIEVARRGKRMEYELSEIHNRVFATYFPNKKVFVGAGFMDLIPSGLELCENTITPKEQLPYSDAKGPQIYKFVNKEANSKFVFSNISEKDLDTVLDLERFIYKKEDFLTEKEELKDIVTSQPENEGEYSPSCFLVKVRNVPVGYVLATVENSEVLSGQRVVYIYDMAVRKEYENNVLSKSMLEKIFASVKLHNIPAIELHARDSTTYRLLKSKYVQRWLAKQGFKPRFYNKKGKEVHWRKPQAKEEDMIGGEDFYFIRLENIGYQK